MEYRLVMPTTRSCRLRDCVEECFYKKNEKLVQEIWVSLLFAEYRTVFFALLGAEIHGVDIEEGEEVRKVSWEEAEKIYWEILDRVEKLRKGEVDERKEFWEMDDDEFIESLFGKKKEEKNKPREVAEHVAMGIETLNYDHFIRAAELVNEMLGTNDGLVQLTPFKPVLSKKIITREDAERIRGLGEKIADMFARLGGRAEAEMLKLVFSGYKEDIVDTIEGLGPQEKDFLKKLLDTPYERASLLFAYKRIGNFRRLQIKILQTIYRANTFSFIIDSYYAPVIQRFL